MEIRALLIAVLIFSGAITGLYLFISDLASNPQFVGASAGMENISMLSQTSAIENATSRLQNVTSEKITGIPILDVPLVGILGMVEFMKLVGTIMFGFWDSFIYSIAHYLYLPTWFVVMIIAIIMIIVLFEIISVLANRRT